MRTFLLTYKPLSAASPNGWPSERMKGLLARFVEDPLTTSEWWRIAAYKQAQMGDEIFILKQGRGSRGIFGLGHIVSGPRCRKDSFGGDGERWRVQVKFNQLVDPESDLILPLNLIEDLPGMAQLARSQSSGITINPKLADTLRGLARSRS